MTATEIEQTTSERTILVREFAADLTVGDGRTVDVRIIPYGISALVSDNGGAAYREEWTAGCFDDQLKAANRVDVLMNFEHERGIGGLVGRGTALRSETDGLHGSFRVFDGQDGDKALELVREGILGGVSLEAYPKKSIRGADGVVRRVKAHLDKVALCRRPAFKDALVLAVREEDITFDEAMLPVEINPDLVAKLRALGIALPARLTAHPDDSEHPGQSGTLEDGTRQTENNDGLEGAEYEGHTG